MSSGLRSTSGASSVARLARSLRAIPLRPRWTDASELMDAPDLDPAVLERTLGDLRRLNRLLGGVRLTLRGLDHLTRDLRPSAPLTVLDVATGGADIPAAVLRWADRRGFRAQIIATDRSAAILGIAARRAPAGLALAAADAHALPFADGSVDIAMCSLALHHFRPEDGVRMLREMGRVARRGIIVNDLDRNWFAFAAAWLAGHLLARNSLTRHDGPLSVRRAYTRVEMATLVERAGLRPVHVEGHLGYRTLMVAAPAP